MLHEEFPERVFITIIPYVREISAMSFWTYADRKFARKSIGKSCNGFAGHAWQIGAIKTLSFPISFPLSPVMARRDS